MLNQAYRSRLRTAREAVCLIPDGARVVMGLGVSQPPALLGALADRARAGDIASRCGPNLPRSPKATWLKLWLNI